MRPDKTLIEPRFKESIDRYIEYGVPTGGFLEAVMSNDLREAVGRADEYALENIPHIVAYLYNDTPMGCWGSRENVQSWLGRESIARDKE